MLKSMVHSRYLMVSFVVLLPCDVEAIDCQLCIERDDLSQATNWLMQSEKASVSQMSLPQVIINQAILPSNYLWSSPGFFPSHHIQKVTLNVQETINKKENTL